MGTPPILPAHHVPRILQCCANHALLPASWCLDNQGLAEPGETAPSTSEFLGDPTAYPFAFQALTDKPRTYIPPTSFIRGLTFQPTFTCTNHPRARYQTQLDQLHAPEATGSYTNQVTLRLPTLPDLLSFHANHSTDSCPQIFPLRLPLNYPW